MIAMPFDENSADPTPIFLAGFRISDGRKEHVIYGMIFSPTLESAIDAANEYLCGFWGSDTTKDGAYMVYWSRNWSASIHLESINQVTVHQLLRGMLFSETWEDSVC